MARLLILVILAGLLAGCVQPTPGPTPTPDPCSPSEVQKYLDAINAVARRYDDARTLAGSTSRLSLSPVIKDLQEIRRNTEDLVLPMCALKAKTALIAYMNADIDTLLAFMAQKTDADVKVLSDKTVVAMKEYRAVMGELGVTFK
jgi:hypothetical protein